MSRSFKRAISHANAINQMCRHPLTESSQIMKNVEENASSLGEPTEAFFVPEQQDSRG
ncbi:hypothetical protein SynPROSU1_02459 [Synechococcus sp. PROS-U-1]|nr:hypothetical protein SynPROSU1_02459 [Synechococcus sp. PROS-U-1]